MDTSLKPFHSPWVTVSPVSATISSKSAMAGNVSPSSIRQMYAVGIAPCPFLAGEDNQKLIVRLVVHGDLEQLVIVLENQVAVGVNSRKCGGAQGRRQNGSPK